MLEGKLFWLTFVRRGEIITMLCRTGSIWQHPLKKSSNRSLGVCDMEAMRASKVDRYHSISLRRIKSIKVI